MRIGNSAFELAERRAEEERESAIARARAAVIAAGATECVDCGNAIEGERRKAAPFARRCLDCQTFYERETRGRA